MRNRERGFIANVKHLANKGAEKPETGRTRGPSEGDFASEAKEKNQKITLKPIADKTYGDPDFDIHASADSGLPVTFTTSGPCTISGTTVQITGAGKCAVIAHQDGDNIYNSAPDSFQEFTVLPAPLEVIADDKKVKFGSQLPVFTATVSGLVNGFEDLGRLTFEINAHQGSPVGKYPIVPSGFTSNNYTYDYIEGTLTITPTLLEIKVEDATSVYGQPLPDFSVRANGLVNNDTVEKLGILACNCDATQSSQPGSYSVTPEGLNSENYSINYIPGTLTIVPAPLHISADNIKISYGGQLPEFSASASGLVNDDTLESLGLTYDTDAAEHPQVGNYEIVPTTIFSERYQISVEKGILTVEPAKLIISAEPKNITYGSPLPEFTSIITGFVPGDDIKSLGKLNYTTSASEKCTAGDYEIIPSGLYSPNYDITFKANTLTVSPIPVTVTVENKNMVCGEPLPAFNATASGLINGDTLESIGILKYTTDGREGCEPGIYTITAEGLASSNYIFNFKSGTLTVLPKPEEHKIETTESSPPEKTDPVNGSDFGSDIQSVETLPEDISDRMIQPGSELANDTPSASKSEPETADGHNLRLGELMVQEGLISQQDLTKALSKQMMVPTIDLNADKIVPECLNLVPESLARKYKLIPVRITNGYLIVAMADPTDILAIEALSAYTKMRIKPVIVAADEVQASIDRNYKNFGDIKNQFTAVEAVEEETIDESIADAPAVRTLGIIIEEAVKTRASDIHIEPESDKLRLRYRIDGVMHEVMTLPLSAQPPILSRLKVMANMNIADHRPQDGQLSFKLREKEIDVRVATISTAYGEMATLRILDKSFAVRSLEEIGFQKSNLKRYEKMLHSPFGMLLVSGPTGSGKTTTLYASINSLDNKELKIITIEDPVEYHFNGISQIQVNNKAGITFAAGLKSMMRHDPDVALVGEIRDTETASVGVQAALTGHLVLASIHANDSVGVIFRLLDLGVEPFLVSSALMGVVAQRMVRRVCPSCRHTMAAPPEGQKAYHEEIGEHRTDFEYGKGCPNCANTGYLGRIAVMEILTITDEIRRMLISGASADQIRAQAVKEGMISLRHDGMLKVKAGITTPNEILRNVFSLG